MGSSLKEKLNKWQDKIILNHILIDKGMWETIKFKVEVWVFFKTKYKKKPLSRNWE